MSSLHYYCRSYVQMVKLAGVILALSIEVLVGFIPAQPLKATNGEKTAWPSSYGIMTTRKLHCLVGLTYSGVSALAERLKDVVEEARGQRPADAEKRGLKTRGQRDQVWSLNQEVLGHEAKT